MLRWLFGLSEPPAPSIWSDPDTARFARVTVADLRAAAARYPGNTGIAALVAELLAGSAEFAELWAAHDVEPRGVLRKQVNHPLTGPLTLACEILQIQATDQRMIVYCAEPGSPSQAALRRLAATLAASPHQTRSVPPT